MHHIKSHPWATALSQAIFLVAAQNAGIFFFFFFPILVLFQWLVNLQVTMNTVEVSEGRWDFITSDLQEKYWFAKESLAPHLLLLLAPKAGVGKG